MLLLRTDKLPDRDGWLYELKLDGFRTIAFKTGGKVYLRSRNNKDFTTKYPGIGSALAPMPDETPVDGEIVALDEAGRPSFRARQNHDSSTA
jgi:bifunctional non-homologous end joining protein LigD